MPPARRLPPGRHGLSRELVAESQRDRLLRGMTEAVAERGYACVSVADVLRRAGVSRETFYEQFANKEACFLAAYERVMALLTRELEEALSGPDGADEGPFDRLGRALERYLAVLASEPDAARTFLIEGYAAGLAALERRVEGQRFATRMVASLVGARGEAQRFACEALVLTTVGLATQKVGSGEAADLPELHAPLMRLARSSLGAVGIAAP